MITLVDYGVGNINAFVNIYNRLGIETKIARTIVDLEGAKKIILPGVGSFDHAMNSLNNSGLREKLDQLVLSEKVPVMGICVGMQMMAKKSEEGRIDGLNWIDAEVLKFDPSTIAYKTKLPHMGWNEILINNIHPLFSGLEDNKLFYFLHSYYFKCSNPQDAIAVAYYGIGFEAVINYKNIFGIQFHPEKSHEAGEILLKNFSNL